LSYAHRQRNKFTGASQRRSNKQGWTTRFQFLPGSHSITDLERLESKNKHNCEGKHRKEEYNKKLILQEGMYGVSI